MGVSTAAAGVDAVTSNFLSASSIFYMLLLPSLVLWYAYWRLSRRHMLELAEKLPGPPGLPLIGNALEFTGTPHKIFERLYARSFEYNDLVKIWVGPRLLVFIFHPDDVEQILSSQVHLDKAQEYRFFEPWLGNGLLISSGQKWRSHRKLIAPTFHLNVLKSFIDVFNSNSRDLVAKLKKEGEKNFDCHDYMSECTVEILLETAMGVSKKTQDRSGFEYAMAVLKMSYILHIRHTKLWLHPDFAFNFTKYAKLQTKLLDIIHGLTKKVIKSKKEELAKGQRPSTASILAENQKKEEASQTKDKTVIEGLSYGQSAGLKDDLDVEENDVGEKKRLAFLDLLLESSQNGVVINDHEIKEQVDTIMFEGHDTTASGSSFFLSVMGVHQDIQDKVVEELNSIFGDSDRPATFQDTLEMKYLERCLMETLRLYPPVPLIGRELKEDVKLVSGHVIPAGTTTIIGTYKVHRRAETYPNPEVFNPDNFLPENCANRHYYSFIPFSAGPRSCVGRKFAMLKLKIMLSTLLRNFRVYSDLTEEEFKLQADIILKREEGFRIRLAPRKKMAAA